MEKQSKALPVLGEIGNEVSGQRTENGKRYEIDPKLDLGQYGLEAHTGPIHYRESYADHEPWLDIDANYCEPGEIKGIGRVLVYPRLPNIVTIYQDRCGYQIQSRSNRDHLASVELVSIDGQKITTWKDSAALKTYVKINPYRVGIWKEFLTAREESVVMRWKITEKGRPDRDSHPFFFFESPDAFISADLSDLVLGATKVKVKTTRTRIDDTSWYWDELIIPEARLVDTDWAVAAETNDGYAFSDGDFQSGSSNRLWVGQHWLSPYAVMNFWARFTNITIARESVIESCSFSVYGEQSKTLSSGPALYFVLEDNASNPTSYADYNGRSVGSAAAWSGYFAAGVWHTFSTLASRCQVVINRAGWNSGNAMMIFFKGAAVGNQAVFKNYGTGYAPKLSITYSAPVRRNSTMFVPNVSWLSKSYRKRREI